jgi:hypothetical protein
MIADTAIVCPDVAGGTAQCAIGPTALHPAPLAAHAVFHAAGHDSDTDARVERPRENRHGSWPREREHGTDRAS